LYFGTSIVESIPRPPINEFAFSPICSSPSWFSHASTSAPTITPQMFPMPPTITMQRMITEIWKEKLVGKMPLMKAPQ
jgi:hypothetical protein